MLNRIAVSLSKKLLSCNTISEEIFDIYVYGLELLISSLFSTTVVLLIGILSGCILQTIAFLITFILLRSFTGGFHANTYLLCSVVTFSTFTIVLLLSKFVSVPFYAYLILAVSGLGIITWVAPVENPNKVLTASKKLRCKITSIVLFVILIFVGIFTTELLPSVSNAIFFTLLADIILLFIKNKKRKE